MLTKHVMRWGYMKYFFCEFIPGDLLTYPENLKSLTQQERSLNIFLDHSVAIFIFEVFFQCQAKNNFNIFLHPQNNFRIPFCFYVWRMGLCRCCVRIFRLLSQILPWKKKFQSGLIPDSPVKKNTSRSRHALFHSGERILNGWPQG